MYINTKNYVARRASVFFRDMTDQPEKFIIAELIREKALLNLDEEVSWIVVGLKGSSKGR